MSGKVPASNVESAIFLMLIARRRTRQMPEITVSSAIVRPTVEGCSVEPYSKTDGLSGLPLVLGSVSVVIRQYPHLRIRLLIEAHVQRVLSLPSGEVPVGEVLRWEFSSIPEIEAWRDAVDTQLIIRHSKQAWLIYVDD